MLANTLSVEDEEAVQAELRELEAEAVRLSTDLALIISLIHFIMYSWAKRRNPSNFPRFRRTNQPSKHPPQKLPNRSQKKKGSAFPYRLEFLATLSYRMYM